MKIFLLGTAYPFRGGLAAYNERLMREFQQEGHEVEIITFTLQYPNFLFPGKTQFADWDAPKNLKISAKLNSINPFNWVKVGKYIKKQKPDLLIIKYWLPFMGPSFGTVARIAKKNKITKVVSILDNIIPHESRPGDKWFSKYFVSPVDAFIGMSQSVLSDLDKFDKNKPRAFCPHPLFDNFGKLLSKNEACEITGLSKETNYLLFFGFIRAYKGLDLIIEAMNDKRIRKMNVKLIVAGEFYEDGQTYYNQIKSLNLDDKIILKTDFIPDDEVSHWFSICDMVVQPYKSATQSGVTQICYHFEKPMLVTDVGGLKEIVPHKKVGYVVDVNAAEVANAIVDFYDNDRVKDFAKHIKEEKKKYLWNRMTSTIKELINGDKM